MAMTASKVLALGFCVASLAACGRDIDGTPFEPDPLAAVRFVNAVPDTIALDYRIVDIVTNAGSFNAAFRTNQPFYTAIVAGPHTIRVFLSSTDVAVTSTMVSEVTHDFVEGASYTFIHRGFMRSGQAPATEIEIVQDDPPAPAAGQVALRALHLGAGMGDLDVFVGTDATAGNTPGATPTWANVAYGTFTPYVQVDTAALRFAATAPGTTTPLIVDNTAAPAGADTVGTSSRIPGVRTAGSVLTVVILPPSVVGSMAASFTTPGFAFLFDRRPPND
jgi:hypothetical protein